MQTKMRQLIISYAILFVATASGTFFVLQIINAPQTVVEKLEAQISSPITNIEIEEYIEKNTNTNFAEPTDVFMSRITKKHFGTYITPQTSPVQPDKFVGYHTGIDVEYDDIAGDVPVYSIANGMVYYSGWARGYGGVAVVKHSLEIGEIFSLYGHIDPDRLPAKNTQVEKGQIIGYLGEGYSQETDETRKHLHFSIYTGEDMNLKGYVPQEEQLSGWIDPLLLY